MIIKSWSLPLKKNWQFAQEKILSSVTIFNLLGCWELSSLEELSGFKSCLDVEIVSLTLFLSAHLPYMMIRGSEGYMEKSMSNKVGIILTCTTGSFSKFSFSLLPMCGNETRKLEVYFTNSREI